MIKLKFTVTDSKTGKQPDLWNIALEEDWADELKSCYMEGFAIQEDGTLVLMDKCGNYAYCPKGRFSVQIDVRCEKALEAKPHDD